MAAWSCASTGDPPGGPPDTTPPTMLSSVPESGAVLDVPPRRVEMDFDEVISERIAAQQPTIAGAFLVSPARTPVSVDWHRDHVTISVKGGFAPGVVYRVEMLPVIVDLRQNRMKKGRTIVFSTGPAIPSATLAGTIVDWTGGRAATGALIEAMLLPDSLPYLGLTDSAGNFSLGQMPPGDYLVYGILDQNNNRKRDPREAFDTARVALTDSASVALYAFTHDTIGPRLRSVDDVDSVTLRIVFDRPVSPDVAVDTLMVHVVPMSDSTVEVPLLKVYTTSAFDSTSKAEAAARAAAQAARDSVARAARDSTARAQAARDTTHRRPEAAPAAAPAPTARPLRPPPLAGARRDTIAARRDSVAARRDTSRAVKMLAQRPAPSDTRIVRLAAALAPATRYIVTTAGVVGLTGVVGRGRTTFTTPRPKPPAADSLHRARADSSRTQGAPAPARDTTPAAPHADTLRARHDTVPPSPRPG